MTWPYKKLMWVFKTIFNGLVLRRGCVKTLGVASILLVKTHYGFAQDKGVQQHDPSAQVPAARQQSAVPPAGPQEHPYSLTVITKLVTLDVVVEDKKGNVVGGLSKDDFQIYEDQIPQAIRSFERAPSVVSPTAGGISVNSTAELDKREPDAPVSIIVLDELTTSFRDEGFTRYSLKKYLATESDTLRQPTMLIASNIGNMQVLRDYTTSKEEILSALDRHFAGYNWQAASGSWRAEEFMGAYSSLMSVARATAGHRGHKNLIWIGHGFPSVEWQALTPETADKLRTMIADCLDLLIDARVTLYAVDPSGLSSNPVDENEEGLVVQDPFINQVDFTTMARATGGQVFYGANDVDHLIANSIRNGALFYTLSYRPSSEGSASKEFRGIRVVMKNADLVATTRLGYYTEAPAVAPVQDAQGKLSTQLVFDMSSAIKELIVYDAIHLTVARNPDAPGSFRLYLKASDLGWQNVEKQPPETDITVVLEAFDRKGRKITQLARIDRVRLTNSSQGAVAGSVILTHSITMQPSMARIRFVVRDNNNGKIGAENLFLVDRSTLADPATGVTPQHFSH